MAGASPLRLLSTFFLFLFFLSTSGEESLESETQALLNLKASFTNTAKSLSTWTNKSTPCDKEVPWAGVICKKDSVHALRLGNMGLSGTVNDTALTSLHGLRILSFRHNALTGEIPDLSKLTGLKAIYINDNRFKGPIPDDFFMNLRHLKKLFISKNGFSGEIPSSIGNVSSLMDLQISNNQFSGHIPNFKLPNLRYFNASNNLLDGKIPDSFKSFGKSSFIGNVGLCGAPLDSCKIVVAPKEKHSTRPTVVAVVLFLVTFVLVAGTMLIQRAKKKKGFDGANLNTSSNAGNARGQQKGSWRPDSYKKGQTDRAGPVAELVVMNQDKGAFGLPDLMKASAEVLANGSLGSAYKAVMSNGMSVVVKRLRDMNQLPEDVFNLEMKKLGNLRHPNLLSPVAYHYRNEEKLVVLHYVDKGSLLFVLHGDKGPNHAALDYPTRLKIIQGISSGLEHLHRTFPDSQVPPHGNLKSSNILLGQNFNPIIVDHGYIPFISQTQASTFFFAYKSPEYVHYHHVSPKSDVYCLGVIILEVLTGKFPSQYVNNGKGGTDVLQWVTDSVGENKERETLDPEIVSGRGTEEVKAMERLLRLAVELVDPNPDNRPSVTEIVAKLEDIAKGKITTTTTTTAANDGKVSLVKRDQDENYDVGIS